MGFFGLDTFMDIYDNANWNKDDQYCWDFH